MATPTITKNLTDLWTAESSSSPSWTGLSPATYTDFQREGTYCLGEKCSKTTVDGYIAITSADMTGSRIYVWMKCNGEVETKANGGFRIVVGDGTNRRIYYVGGSDDYGFQVGGWNCFMLDCDNPPTGYTQDAGSVEPDFSAVTQVGVGFYTITSSLANADNVGAGNGVTLADIAADDALTTSGKAYGIVREIDAGVYGVQGNIRFGSGASSCYFEADDDTILLEDHVHGSGTPAEFTIDTAVSIGYCSVRIGTIVGSGDTRSGRNGLTVLNANQTNVVNWTFSVTDSLTMYGCTFVGVNGDLTCKATGGVNQPIVAGCSFTACGKLIPWDSASYSTLVRNCLFVSTAEQPVTGVGDSAYQWPANGNLKYCQFIDHTDATENPHGIEFTVAGEYDLTDVVFTGCDYDIEFSAASGNLIVNNLRPGTSNASTSENTGGGAGSITINTAVTIKVTGLTEGAQASMHADPAGTELMNDQAGTTGEVSATYAYTSDQDVIVRARASGTIVSAKQWDGGSYSDESEAARSSETTGDMNITDATPSVNDAYYFGMPVPFSKLWIVVHTTVESGVLVWEHYETLAGWTTNASLVDGTSGFQNAGRRLVSFTPASLWTTFAVDSKTLYWLRCRWSAAPASQAKASECSTNAGRYKPFVANATILDSGLVVPAVWIPDTIADNYAA
jgi:hypothetical protein